MRNPLRNVMGERSFQPKIRNPFRGMLSKSFLERNQKVIGLIGVLVLLGGSAFALLLSGGIFAKRYHVTAYFTDAAGINPGDDVTVAGLPAGMVKSVQIQGGRVAMDLAIDSGIELPSDSRADIVVQTLLGKEAVNLVAGEAKSKLADGATISVDHTTTPIDITQLNDISVRLLNRSDAGALNKLMEEVATITADKQGDVHTLVQSLAQITGAVNARRQQLSRLLDSLRTLTTTFGERDQTIVSLIDNLTPVLTNLAAHQQQLVTLLEATDSASHETANLVIRNRKVLDATLSSLHTDLNTLNSHQLDLAATISYLNASVFGYQSVGYSQCQPQATPQCTPNHWANIFVQSLGIAGPDALLAQCGVIDQLIDDLLGTDCKDSKKGSGNGNGGGPLPVPTPTLPPVPGGGGIPPLPTPSLPIPTPSIGLPTPSLPLPTQTPPLLGNVASPATVHAALPGDLGDLIAAVLQGTDGGQLR